MMNNAVEVSSDVLKRAVSMGIPEEVAHLFTDAGLNALDTQAQDWERRWTRAGEFERYCDAVVEGYLAACGLTFNASKN